MNVLSLRLINYRNYEQVQLRFHAGAIHCFRGENAQGKTNLMESLFFLSHLHSFRTQQDEALILHGQSLCMVEARVDQQDLRVVLQGGKKSLFAYKDPVLTYSNFVGRLNAVLFCPDDLYLFQQPPKMRRQLLDMELVKLSKTYTAKLSHYQSLLKQRNALLKKDKIDELLLNTYTQMMIDDQLVIHQQRQRFLKEWLHLANQYFPSFSGQQLTIEARLVSTLTDCDKQACLQLYQQHLQRDQMMKTTTIGIHRDDIEFMLDHKPILQHASQGQKRSFMLALKMSLCSLIFQQTGQSPVLLLDDVFSELDAFHQKQLLKLLPSNLQTFITTAQPIPKEWFLHRTVYTYDIQQGTIKEANHA